MTSGRGGRAPGVRHTGIVAGEPRDEEVVFHHPADGGPGGRVGRLRAGPDAVQRRGAAQGAVRDRGFGEGGAGADARRHRAVDQYLAPQGRDRQAADGAVEDAVQRAQGRSEEHTSELQSLMRISYAVFCLKKKKKTNRDTRTPEYTNE